MVQLNLKREYFYFQPFIEYNLIYFSKLERSIQ